MQEEKTQKKVREREKMSHEISECAVPVKEHRNHRLQPTSKCVTLVQTFIEKTRRRNERTRSVVEPRGHLTRGESIV
jgi:hypothetical protein